MMARNEEDVFHSCESGSCKGDRGVFHLVNSEWFEDVGSKMLEPLMCSGTAKRLE